jgi:SAM-dependent methyltransferase
MEHDEYRRMFELEDGYWWFAGRRYLVRRLLDEMDLPPHPRILDAGCGTGAGLDNLERRAPAFGIDVSPEALRFCRRRGKSRLLASSLEQPGIRDATFDVVTALDVLEHCDDDGRVLRALFRVLRPGGSLIVTVPAYPFLWSEHDEALHHKRRYRARELRRAVLEAGFSIRRMSGLVSSFLPAVVAFRVGQMLLPGRKGPRASFVELPGPVNALLTFLLVTEVESSRRLPIPFGVTIYVVAQRPASVTAPVAGREAVPALALAASPAVARAAEASQG